MRLGLGTALLTALASRARAAGIVRFTGTVNAENTAIKRLVDNVLGPHETRSVGYGAQEISVDLRRAG
jgi:ribosomal protein S18 acetylase RimI-like enzyme